MTHSARKTSVTKLFWLSLKRKQKMIVKKAGNSITNQATFGFILRPQFFLVNLPYGAFKKNKIIKIRTETANKEARSILKISFSENIIKYNSFKLEQF